MRKTMTMALRLAAEIDPAAVPHCSSAPLLHGPCMPLLHRSGRTLLQQMLEDLKPTRNFACSRVCDCADTDVLTWK